jgi:O-antigen ligase
MSFISMDSSFAAPQKRPARPLRFLLVPLLFVVGFAVVFIAEAAHRVEAQGFRVIASLNPLKAFCLLTIGSFAVILLLRYPEVTLALFFLVGLIKADPHFAAAPMDLTLAVGGLLILASVYRLFTSKRPLQLPREYFLYLPLLSMMVLSLTYTPDLAGGFDKFLRFTCLTSIGILAPFVLIDDERKLTRLFLAMTVGGLLISIQSLTSTTGDDRLVSPSGLNTELGAASALAIIIIWNMVFPNWSLLKRILLYPVLGVLAVALVGSGGRFANIITALCVLLGAFLCRKLITDLVLAGVLGILALPFIHVPAASIEYLASLAHPRGAMGTRDPLLRVGVQVFSHHPFFGIGLQGYRSVSPNPITYNFPHNIFLELGAELGMIAAFAFLALAFYSFRESFRQIRDPLLRRDPLVVTVFLLLIYVFVDAMQSGDINDLRLMWFIFGLPFLLRILEPSARLILVPEQQFNREFSADDSPLIQPAHSLNGLPDYE